MLEEYHDSHQHQLPLRPTRVEVSVAALHHNFRVLAACAPGGADTLMPVVKANAYGHGIVSVSHELLNAGAQQLAVGFLEEGILLRREGITCPILVLGGLVDYQLSSFLDYDLMMTVSSMNKVRQLGEVLAGRPGTTAKVHLKIDLDMERIGVHEGTVAELIASLKILPEIHIKGVYSHFANADAEDPGMLQNPLKRFQALQLQFREHLPPDCVWHMANSMALARLGIQCNSLELHRPGLLLYGVQPELYTINHACYSVAAASLQPALRWTSQVVYFKVVAAGAGVSYGHQYRPKSQTRLVTIPVGYGDGYPRGMSGRAQVLIRGKRYPVVGSICMDQLMVDIGPEGEAYNGDEVVLIGRQAAEQIHVEDLARWNSTIPWEILTGISQRVPRTMVPDSL